MLNKKSEINKIATENPKELIKLSEERYKTEIENIIERVSQKDSCRILLLAGPSGSGKTTSAHILEEGFKKRNIDAEVVSLDNFYLGISQMPLGENGEPDFETVYALDIPLIHRCFTELLENEKTNMPIFDFKNGGRQKEFKEIDIENHGVIIIEGLHAINPVLTDNLPKDSWLSVYISPNSTIFDDKGNECITSRMLRLARSMSRDFLYRNTTASETLKLWTYVIAGEEKYLYKFKNVADIRLKTFHCYEPCIFRDIVLKLLENLPKETENYAYAMRLKNALTEFVPLPLSVVPETSLIREFIEGSRF
jgi:uridine kinase